MSKRFIAFILCLVLFLAGAVVTAEETIDLTGKWVETFDIAREFEYKKGDISAQTDRIWKFAGDGTITQYFADVDKVSAIALSLMTKIITDEISAEGAKISDVAKEEGFGSVQAFIQAIIRNEKLDTYGSREEKGTYTVSGNELTFAWNHETNENATAVYTCSFENGKLILHRQESGDEGKTDETVTLEARK